MGKYNELFEKGSMFKGNATTPVQPEMATKAIKIGAEIKAENIKRLGTKEHREQMAAIEKETIENLYDASNLSLDQSSRRESFGYFLDNILTLGHQRFEALKKDVNFKIFLRNFGIDNLERMQKKFIIAYDKAEVKKGAEKEAVLIQKKINLLEDLIDYLQGPSKS